MQCDPSDFTTMQCLPLLTETTNSEARSTGKALAASPLLTLGVGVTQAHLTRAGIARRVGELDDVE